MHCTFYSPRPAQESESWEWQLCLETDQGQRAYVFHPEAAGKMRVPILAEQRGPPQNPALVGIAKSKAALWGGPGWKGNPAKPLPPQDPSGGGRITAALNRRRPARTGRVIQGVPPLNEVLRAMG